jgi:cyanophycin synthetase
MKILNIKTVLGPNVYHHSPVIIMRLDLGVWTEVASNQVPGFLDKLIRLMPGLNQHTCSLGEDGGFVERLRRGTYPAHIIEHIALEFSQLCGIGVSYGKTRYAGKFGYYDVVTRFENEEGMKQALRSAFEMLQCLFNNKEFNLRNAVAEIRKIIMETRLGPSAEAILQAAKKRNIPVRRIGGESLIQMGWGKHRRRVQTAVSNMTNLIAVDLVQDKFLTKQMLKENGIPVPEGFVVTEESDLEKIPSEFNGPFALKPLDGHHGNGVTLHLKSKQELLRAFHASRIFSSKALLEEMCPGKDYRVLVVNGRFVAAAERKPPLVFGDGESSILKLIEQINQDPRRGEGHGSSLTVITIDENLLETLNRQGMDLQSVPTAGKSVMLRENANLSSGGTSKDVTDEVHVDVRHLCERIARIVDLDICGIDMIHHNISEPVTEDCKIIEVNAGPGLRMHLAPAEGEARNIADEIIRMLYPEPSQGRIPIVSVTGTNGKTTTARLLGKILSRQYKNVGMTTSDGVWMGDTKILEGDTTGPQSCLTVLSDPLVEAAVFEVARGGILRGGLAYDWSDVSVVTNIRPDHIGQDGIEDLDDIVWIKSLVAERVKPGGTLILNADDKESCALKDNARVLKFPKKIILFSLNATNLFLNSHLRTNGDACWFDREWIYLKLNGNVNRVIKASEVPCTMGGRADFQISNVLAVVAAASAMGISLEDIQKGLKEFHPAKENLGRLNIYKVGRGYLIVDYGHNPDAVSAIGEFLRGWRGFKKTAIFGLPGDRADHLIERSGLKVSEYFDRLVLRDDFDLRGRQPGEVPQMLQQIIRSNNPEVQCDIILEENQAIETVLDHIAPDEIVVLFYDVLEPVMKVIRQYDPVPIDALPVQPSATATGFDHSRGDEIRELLNKDLNQ